MAYPAYNPYAPLTQYQYQPGANQFAPQYPVAQQMAQPSPQQEAYICRPVTSREEAVATPTDFMRPLLMPDLSHGRIYIKRFNPQTGSSDLFDFAAVEQEASKPAPQYATVEELNALREEVEKMKKPASRGRAKADETE